MALQLVLKQFASNKALYQTSVYFLSKRIKNTMADYSINDIKFETVKEKIMKREATLIDVREPSELKDDGKIPNAINIPLSQIMEAFELPDSIFQSKYGVAKPKPEASNLIISCRSGKRAATAFSKLQPLGYKNAFVYSGSFQDWVKNGGATEK